MPNPFDKTGISRQPKEELGWEEVGGTFSCDERGCMARATTALYHAEQQVLKWECPDGHWSLIKGFVL